MSEPNDWTDLVSSIGSVLKQQREAKGLTKVDVAKQTGYSTSSILNMERGNQYVLWSRYTRYMAELGITWKFVPIEDSVEPTSKD